MYCTLIEVNMNEKYLLGWFSTLPFFPLPTTVSALKYLRKRVEVFFVFKKMTPKTGDQELLLKPTFNEYLTQGYLVCVLLGKEVSMIAKLKDFDGISEDLF